MTGKRGGIFAMSAITSRGRLIFQLHDKRIASQEVCASNGLRGVKVDLVSFPSTDLQTKSRD